MEAPSWQTKLFSIKERNQYAFDKSLFCDVDLTVIDANGDKVTVPAHKYILAISSPVFEAMFYGILAETGRIVDLPDCTKEGLQELLRYVYSDEVNLIGSNVLEILYLAEKYMLPFLKEKCDEYLEKELKPEEVFHVLPQIRNEKLEQECWDMVDRDTERAVCSEAFLKTSKELLCRVLRRDTICVDELVLFQAVEKWTLNKMKENGLEDSGKNKRAVLGEDAVKLIRFPLMSQEKFADKVLPSGILTLEEVTELIQLYNKLAPLSGSFSNKERGISTYLISNKRFDSIKDGLECATFWHYWGKLDGIDFRVNKHLFLVGVRLFGNKDSIYTVTDFTLYKSSQTIKKIQSSTIPTESEQTDGYYGFNIIFDKPVALDPHFVYTIVATISGPRSYCGEKGKTTIQFEDIIITYINSEKSSNCTSITGGQFPSLLLKRP